MRDPFLRDHFFRKGEFIIAGRIQPFSLRDQMIRAEMFVRRAKSFKIIGPNRDKPFVVIGGGAAGATAAALATGLGIKTVLVDAEVDLFSAQCNCGTRWLCPTVYDYPADHFFSGNFPPSSRSHPLKWQASWAQLVATTLRGKMLTIENSSNLKVYRNSFAKITRTPLNVRVVTKPPNQIQTTENLSPDVVLTTTGFGRERTFLEHPSRFRGVPFWESDEISSPNLGLTSGTIPSVVLSGAGDGGLQDLIRVVTGLSIEQVCSELFDVLEAARSRVMDAEQAAVRGLHWNSAAADDHEQLFNLHKCYNEIADHFLEDDTAFESVSNLLRRPLPKVTLIATCDHFPLVYPLNHFLALLFAKTIKKLYGIKDVILYSHRIDHIRSDDPNHKCNFDAFKCYGEQHTVETVESTQCGGKPTTIAGPTYKPNIVVVRHGAVTKVTKKFECRIRGRQILPFDLDP